MTLSEYEAALVEWETALSRVSKNQSYAIEGRSLTRADASEIRKTIDWLERKIGRLKSKAAGKGATYYVG